MFSCCENNGFTECAIPVCQPSCMPGERCTPDLMCVACSAGQFQDGNYCATCPAGKFASNGKNITTGGQKKQTTTKATTCSACPAGTFTSTPASIVCQTCAPKTTSLLGSYSCELAAENYFVDPVSGAFEECPSGSYCAGSGYLPQPQRGYWVERNLINAGRIFNCRPRDTCSGGREYKGELPSCWTTSGYTTTECSDDSLQCTEGAWGPLCGKTNLICDVSKRQVALVRFL